MRRKKQRNGRGLLVVDQLKKVIEIKHGQQAPQLLGSLLF